MKATSSSPDFSDQDTVRDIPHIPDYELIRCVGKGAYGEVWLGRSVTGSLRAVKIVRRETFEMERTFRREVEGIENFEPISRGHPGLVDILHVGWKKAEGFFYYMMELADDRLHGQKIQLTDYEPRTLASARAPGQKLALDQCIDVGISLADALAYLHERNLIHRDIKPSNVVFVDGEAKLVDIGLVAPTGQKTFVGTEGFVPPEGPGSASADLYSLGMVLYEISTGNDRLEFPELPTTGFSKQDLPKWQRFNAIICKACAPNPAKRYMSARGMTEDLRDLRAGRKPKISIGKRLAQCALVVAVLAIAGLAYAEHEGLLPHFKLPWQTAENSPTTRSENIPKANNTSPVKGEEETLPVDPATVSEFGRVRIDSSPKGATVFLNGTQALGKSGVLLDPIPSGNQEFELRLEGYDSKIVSGTVDAQQPLVIETVALQLSKGPRPGQAWTNSLGIEFRPASVDGHRLSVKPMTADLDHAPAEIRKIPWNFKVERIGNHPALSIQKETADALCEAITSYEQQAGFIPPDYLYEPAAGPLAPGFVGKNENRSYFHLKLTTFASLTVITNPAGAEIWLNDELQPTPAPVTLSNLKSGVYDITFKKEGYEDVVVTSLTIAAGTQETLSRTLEESHRIVFGKVWNNSLDMRFIPLDDIMLSRWETRREDYDLFAESTGRGTGHVPKFHQEPNHPVVGVNREDAEEFCRWLTSREQQQGLIPEDVAYRLPTDVEWSLAAGLEAERGSTPKERHRQSTGRFPWGFVWPPPQRSGNLADASPGSIAAREEVVGDLGTGSITEYADDGYAFTAPVGSYPADKRGRGEQFYDLAGNVWEWIADDYDPMAKFRYGVLRGGSWNTSDMKSLWTTSRYDLPPDFGFKELTWEYGFRCAIARRPTIE